MSLPAFLEQKLVVVTGKGGVGRTTVSAGLALAAAQQGKTALVIEMSGTADVAEAFGISNPSFEARQAAPGVWLMTLTPAECLSDFGRRKLGAGKLLTRLLNNRVSRAFLDAVPGLHDLLQLGKIENLINEPGPSDRRYDVVILDAPATGHGLTLLAAARAMREMTRVGPFHDLARVIELFLADPAITSVVLTTLPEALPVNESLQFASALEADGATLGGVIVNQLRPRPVPEAPAWATVREGIANASSPWSNVLPIADRAVAQYAEQEAVLRRLIDALPDGCPQVRVPRVEEAGLPRIDAVAQATLEQS